MCMCIFEHRFVRLIADDIFMIKYFSNKNPSISFKAVNPNEELTLDISINEITSIQLIELPRLICEFYKTVGDQEENVLIYY